MNHRATFSLMNIWWWIYFFSNEFRWWACKLLCSFLLPSEGVPACCDCCASLASLYTSHTPSMSFYEIVSIFYWTPHINLCFCLCVLCASVSVSCVLLSLCPVCFCLETAAAFEHDAMDWAAGYGWLWLVMRFSLVLGTEIELSVAVQEGAGRRRQGLILTLFWP